MPGIRRIDSRQAIMRIFTHHERSPLGLTYSKSQKIRYAINSKQKHSALFSIVCIAASGTISNRDPLLSSTIQQTHSSWNPKNNLTKSSFTLLLHGPQPVQPMSMECENHTLKGYEPSLLKASSKRAWAAYSSSASLLRNKVRLILKMYKLSTRSFLQI